MNEKLIISGANDQTYETANPKSVSTDCNLFEPTSEMLIKRKYKKVPRITPSMAHCEKMAMILNC